LTSVDFWGRIKTRSADDLSFPTEKQLEKG
jgi:hypothetical protein